MNSNSILPYIDYEALKRNPKIIIGYSDVTAILLAIFAQTGIVTYYGPALVASFGELPAFVDSTYKYLKEITMDETKIPYLFELLNIGQMNTLIGKHKIEAKKKEKINVLQFARGLLEVE